MNKENYDTVELEILRFENEDVIVTSNEGTCPPVCQDTGKLVD